MQSRQASVKCPANGELSPERKAKACDLSAASRCYNNKKRAASNAVQQIYDAKEVPAMNLLFKKFVSSAKELKKIHSLAGMSMLISLSVVLSFFDLNLNESLRISFDFIAIALLGMLYGPFAGGICAGLSDIVAYLIKPTGPFFPGFTITSILGGIIYGVFFYKSKPDLWKAVAAKTLINLFLNSMLNTVWLSIMLGKAMEILQIPRLIKNLIMLPIEVVLLYVAWIAVAKALSTAKAKIG